ncbi:MAG: RHS repeat domain-containing protein, partial [Byssovorax sp.]
MAVGSGAEEPAKTGPDRALVHRPEWVLGQLQTQTECSTAALLSQCRKLTRTTTIFGETESESTESDDGSLETKLHISYASRDVFGNVLEVTADDAHDHHRSSSTTYDVEGIFPVKHTNAAGHSVLTEHDAGLGVLTRQLDDPDQGTTVSVHDGFGELVASTDALGRSVTLEYDALGRTTTRLDQDGAQSLTTTWSWDEAAHGIGKLGRLTSPDGQKTYAYNDMGQVKALILDVAGQGDSLTARLGYDALGRVGTITYPTPAGAAPFVVARDHDAHGHVLTVRDGATNAPYWRLTDVDDAGRVRQEVFGNGVSTERGYFADKQLLQSFVTTHDATTLQDLAYTYDARRSLASRSDALQPQNLTERFRYDALDRLTCAYFGATEDAAAPCALGYGYDPNGNLTFKSDVGALVYNDPMHPHAVTGAGGESFGYNAVGNQVARPGGATVAYTPFDLPRKITQGGKTVSFGYAGDEQRIRKTTTDAETFYFGKLYERVTEAASGAKTHRYYVHSPERVVAIVTRGGAEAGTRYVHVDHLGSVDVVTREDGSVAERRSYDPFGQRRNPVWDKPVPASFASGTTLGFTGHEGDDEIGLVNMKGRVFDPRIGRFLTTDPLVSAPLSGQSWNPYSYVLNNPLSYVDPSGFDPAGLDGSTLSDMPDGLGLRFTGPTYAGPPAPPVAVEGPREAAQVGAEARPVDVGTTGAASGYVPASVAAVAAVAVVPVTAPGVPGVPVQVPGTPWFGGPLKAPGPFGPNAFGPGSFVEPPLPGAVPLEAPGLP